MLPIRLSIGLLVASCIALVAISLGAKLARVTNCYSVLELELNG